MESLVLKDDKNVKVEIHDRRLAAGRSKREPTVSWGSGVIRMDLLRFCDALLPCFGGVDEGIVGNVRFPAQI